MSQYGKRVLALLTDAFGGYGGISVANRHFLRGLCNWEGCDEVVALPRLIENEPESMPENLDYRTDGLGGKGNWLKALLKILATDRDFDIIWCGHINLVPVAMLAKQITGAPVVLHMHGIDVWEPHSSRLVNSLVNRIDYFISVSRLTKDRFTVWSGIDPQKGFVLPNTIDFSPFSPGAKKPELMEQYGLTEDHYVLMTLGRLAGADRKKGFDRVIEVLPDILKKKPETRYLVAGKGSDRERLEQKAQELGVREQVIFAGYVPEDGKADYYRLADLFVMPSEGEGFGLVLLEAMACGVPAVASSRDGSREAVVNGELGRVIDPRDERALVDAIIQPATTDHLHEAVVECFKPAVFNRHIADIFSRILLN